MADRNELLPEESDEQHQRFMQDLRRLYAPGIDRAQPLARVRQRLLAGDDALPGTRSTSVAQRTPPFIQTYQGHTPNTPTAARRGAWSRRISALAAAVVAALLVTTLAVVLNLAHRGSSGGATNAVQQLAALASLHMIDVTTGWALTKKAVFQTTDGGNHWQEVTPPGARLTPGSAMDSLTASLAWLAIPPAVDPAGRIPGSGVTRIFRTSNGGHTWESTVLPPDQGGLNLAQITFVNAQDGWLLFNQGGQASAERVAIVRTTDGGATWTTVSTVLPASTDGPLPGHLPFGGAKTGIAFLNSSTGWVTGTVSVYGLSWLYITHDGGLTWNQQALPLPPGAPSTQLSLMSPTFFSASEGILPVSFVGSKLTVIYITHDGGASWQSTATVPVALSAADFVDVQHGWVTDGNLLFATSDGGHTWVKQASGKNFKHVIQLDFVSSTQGWAVSSSSVLLKTIDGGNTWV